MPKDSARCSQAASGEDTEYKKPCPEMPDFIRLMPEQGMGGSPGWNCRWTDDRSGVNFRSWGNSYGGTGVMSCSPW